MTVWAMSEAKKSQIVYILKFGYSSERKLTRNYVLIKFSLNMINDDNLDNTSLFADCTSNPVGMCSDETLNYIYKKKECAHSKCLRSASKWRDIEGFEKKRWRCTWKARNLEKFKRNYRSASMSAITNFRLCVALSSLSCKHWILSHHLGERVL